LRFGEQAEQYLYGRHQQKWFDRLETEHDNLDAALIWAQRNEQGEMGLRLAVALGWFWHWRSHFNEGYTWLGRMLAIASDAPGALRVKALYLAGDIANRLADMVSATRLCEDALTLAREIGDKLGTAYSLSSVGFNLTCQGDFVGGLALIEEGIVLFRAADDYMGLQGALHRLAVTELCLGHYEKSKLIGEESLFLARRDGDKSDMAYALNGLGAGDLRLGNVKQAMRQFEMSRTLFCEIRNMPMAILAGLMLVKIARIEGDVEIAWQVLKENLVQCQEMGTTWVTAQCVGAASGLATAKGQPQRAARLLGAAQVPLEADANALALERADFDRDLAATRALLGAAKFESIFAEGQEMSLEQAVAYALREDPDPTTGSPEFALSKGQPLADPLSQREREILRLVADGLSNAEIAQKLFLTVGTVKVHARNIYGKLGVNSRTQAIAQAQKLNLM
jgi:non-specific serine/threonine protein kinase